MKKKIIAVFMAAVLLIMASGCSLAGKVEIGNQSVAKNSGELSLCFSEIEDLSPIKEFKDAYKVAVCNNGLTDISALSGMTSILNLDVSENEITDISVLSTLPQLKILSICGNKISDISALKSLTAVESLNISRNSISDISAIASMKDLVIFDCTSGYPVPFKDVCLLEINRLREKYEGKVKAIGFSGHHLGIAVDVAAYTLGASYIERHYTLDRTWKGTDHAASLEPDGVRRLKRDLNAVYEALSYKREEILPIEAVQREKLKYRKH